MRRIASFLVIPSLILVCLGCAENKTRVAEGAVAGGGLGALAGGLMGGGRGAGIGAAIGATGGALIGSQIEKKPQGEAAAVANPQQLSVMQVVDLKKQGAPDDVIIDEIKRTNSKFSLSADTIDYLKKQGISNNVIDVMMGK